MEIPSPTPLPAALQSSPLTLLMIPPRPATQQHWRLSQLRPLVHTAADLAPLEFAAGARLVAPWDTAHAQGLIQCLPPRGRGVREGSALGSTKEKDTPEGPLVGPARGSRVGAGAVLIRKRRSGGKMVHNEYLATSHDPVN